MSLFPVAKDTNEISPAVLAEALVQTGQAAVPTSQAFLKFTKIGKWVFGVDSDEIDTDEIIAVNPMSFTIGWQGWEDGKPKAGPVVPIHERPSLPPESELEEIKAGPKNGWMKMLGVSLQSLEDGTPLVYNATSYSGKQAIANLMEQCGKGMLEHPEAPIPLVKLSGDSYKHPEYGDIQIPVIKVVGWADGEGKEVKKLAPAK